MDLQALAAGCSFGTLVTVLAFFVRAARAWQRVEDRLTDHDRRIEEREQTCKVLHPQPAVTVAQHGD